MFFKNLWIFFYYSIMFLFHTYNDFSYIFLGLVFPSQVSFLNTVPISSKFLFLLFWSVFLIRGFPWIYGNLLILKNGELKNCLEVVSDWLPYKVGLRSALSLLNPWVSILLGLWSWASRISQRRDIQSPVWLLAFWKSGKRLELRLSPFIVITLFLGGFLCPQLGPCLLVQRSSGSPLLKGNLLFFKLWCGGMEKGDNCSPTQHENTDVGLTASLTA